LDEGNFKTKEEECTKKSNFICKKHVENKVYRVSTSKNSWPEAQATCLKWSGKLVQVNNDYDKETLEGLMSESAKYWIGIDKSQPTRIQ
jgi:hypothetical protein